MTPEELKKLLEEQNVAWKNFRAENDKRLAEIEKNGTASALTNEKVEKLNATISEIQKRIEDGQGAINARLDAMNVGGGAGNRGEDVTPHVKAYNAANPRANIDSKTFTDYQNAFRHFIRKGEANMPGTMFNALTVGQDVGSGLFVTPDVTGPMQKKIYESSPMRQAATVATISTDALEGLIDNDEVTAGWVAETGARNETATPELGKYRIVAHELYAEPRISQQLLDDSAFNVEAWLGEKVADRMSRIENASFITGNGSGRPRGFLDYSKVTTGDATRAWDALQFIATGAAGAFATTNGADVLLDAVYALKAGYRTGAAWMMSRATVGAVRKLKDGQGNYLWVPGSATQPATLHGYGVVEAEDMPAIANNAFAIAFGNFRSAYIIVDRQGARLLRDPFTAKPFVKYYTTRRVGGGLVNGEAIKLVRFAA